MIVVDSSILIDRFRDMETPETVALQENLKARTPILIGDIVLLEVLRGARNERHAENVRREIEKFFLVPMLSTDLAIKAARHYRILRERGKTVYKTPDLIIGTYCIEHGYSLLQRDKDYLPMAEHLGLKLA
ncbi:PIN domain nuclease [Aliirhizobium terrae]|uniref:type II toxin-antitoxin system VapC family toxin n=1 Tax=Terrirhizobium terrae TaxID=2926709 RepID=UPI0025767C13|nr:PIN domain nuclease [Rhizobium sp. CC-CFT758]WJH39456.1 PIN domain nuclease [Rhizobium sp. CC-CFT758]